MKQSRNTLAKSEIKKILTNSTTALSQPEIQTILNNVCDRVTTYRVLERLVEENVIHKIVNTNGITKYAMCNNCEHTHKHDHVHFSCISCQSVTCLENIEPKLNLPNSYKVLEANFIISGICPNCQ